MQLIPQNIQERDLLDITCQSSPSSSLKTTTNSFDLAGSRSCYAMKTVWSYQLIIHLNQRLKKLLSLLKQLLFEQKKLNIVCDTI